MKVLLITNDCNGKQRLVVLEDQKHYPKSLRKGGEEYLCDVETCKGKGNTQQRIAKAAFALGARYQRHLGSEVVKTPA